MINWLFQLCSETKVHQWYSNLLLTPLTRFFSLYHSLALRDIAPLSYFLTLSNLFSASPSLPSLLSCCPSFSPSLAKLLAIQFREAAGSIALAPHTAAAGLDFFIPYSLSFCLITRHFPSLLFLFSWNYAPKTLAYSPSHLIFNPQRSAASTCFLFSFFGAVVFWRVHFTLYIDIRVFSNRQTFLETTQESNIFPCWVDLARMS